MNWSVILTSMLPEHLLLVGMLAILGLEIRSGHSRDGFALAMLSVGAAAAAALFLAVPLAACGGGAEGEDKHEEGESHAEGEGEEDAKGPNGGKLLKNGDFAVEVTIFENGTEPQFRVFATRGGKPVDPKDVQLAITLTRLGGDVDRFCCGMGGPARRSGHIAAGIAAHCLYPHQR